MTKERLNKLEEFQKHTIEKLDKLIQLMEKMCALMVSDQLLNECVSAEGAPRTAEECAEIVKESFCASLCLSKDMEDDQRGFEYSVSEFFVGDDDDEEDETPPNIPSVF